MAVAEETPRPSRKKRSKKDDGELLRRLKAWCIGDLRASKDWREDATEDFEFYSGEQWSTEERQDMEDQARPTLVFNRIAPLVNAVVGSEVNNRREVRYIPREMGDAAANEVLSAAADWFRDNCDAEDEESDSFQDAVICGLGTTETRLDFDADPDGEPRIERIDPLEMAWDRNALKPNMVDASRAFRIRQMPLNEAREMFPDADDEDLNAVWAHVKDMDSDIHRTSEVDPYGRADSVDDREGMGDERTVVIVEAQWFEMEPYWRGPDLDNPMQMKEYAEEQIEIIRKMVPEFPAVQQRRSVTHRAFIGATILQHDKPLTPPGYFTWQFMTGYRDKTRRRFYGIVRAAKDPQRWSNKFFSQVMDILNSLAKGGLMMERGAAEDDQAFEETWAQPRAISYLNPGALSGDKPKVMPKPTAQFPNGFFTLFQESKDAISRVTGLSEEFMGTREVNQPGVLEYQRRQSSLNLLASLFGALRRYRKRQGRVMLYLIQEHLSDGRLIRIVGDDKAQYVPLAGPSVADKRYDIIVDDAPNSPNEREKVWEIIKQLLPVIAPFLTPSIGLDLIRYMPLPNSLIEKIVEHAKQDQQAQGEAQQDPVAEAKAQEAQISLQTKQAGAEIDIATQQAKFALEVQRLQLEAEKLALQQQKAQSDADVARTRNMNRLQEARMRQRNVI